MCRRLILLVCLFALLGLVNDASAFTRWTGQGDGTSWHDPVNWDPCGVPGASEEVDINFPPYRGPIIDDDVECGRIHGPVYSPNTVQVMDIISDSVKINGEWRFCQGANTVATINISGGNVDIAGEWRWADSGGDSPWPIGIVNITGGSVVCMALKIGDDGGGELNVIAGGSLTISSGGQMEVKGEQTTILTIDGGTITVNGELHLSGDEIIINLNEGTFECTDLRVEGGYLMDIEAGSFIIDGNKVSFIEGEVSDGRITAYDERPGSQVNIEYDSDLDKTIVTASTIFTWARNPSPSNYAENLCPNSVTLSWTPGVYVDDHNVYFGTSLSDVNASASPVEVGWGPNTYTPTGLTMGTTYYWRIDTVKDACDTSPWEGDIWQFTTNDGNAFDPYPADGQRKVPLDATLTWSSGCLAASHDVYFGTDYDEVSAAEGASEPNVDYEDRGTLNYYDACTPDYSTYYYWRVDEVNGPSKWRGQVWKFRSQGSILDEDMYIWYRFDANSGTKVTDYSGYENHGAIIGAEEGEWEPNDGHFDGALRFLGDEDGYMLSVPSETLSNISSEVTVSVWVKAEVLSTEHPVFDAGDGKDGAYKITGLVPDASGTVTWRAGNDSNDVLVWYSATPKAWIDTWHHIAFVKDEIEDKMIIYFDGLKADSKTGVDDTLSNIPTSDKFFKIGAHNYSDKGYQGVVDDFRFYGRALTPDEIAGIFRGGDLASAWGPSPYNGEVDVSYDVVLMWRPGDWAADVNGHEVYLGTSFDDINDVNSSNYASYPDVQYSSQDACSYDPCGLLDLDQIYYWRVDEVNAPNTWRGNIWRFTTANFITIDDFEDDTAQDPPSNDWLKIGSADITLRSTSPVIGKHSMRYTYYNGYYFGDGYYSEIESISLEPNDWTGFELKLLSLWFYGQSANAATITEQMYVFLKDNDGNDFQVKYGDAAWEDITDVQIEDWQEWLIPLSHFSTNDVNLANLDNLCIGFGIRGWGAEAGNGVVYFDNIRLYPSSCIPSLRAPPAADLNNDCVVDYEDVEIMADEWLEVDVNLSPVQPPSEANLVGWWKLDDGAGSIVTDYASYDNNGVIETIDVNAWWVSGYDGNALEFDGGRVRVPDAQNLRPLHQVSACAWIYYSEGQDAARVVVKGADNKECYEIEISDNDYMVFLVRDGNDYDAGDDSYEKYAAESNEVENPLDRNEWIHVAGTYDGNVIKCYINGEAADVCDTQNAIVYLCQDTNDLAIGNRSDDKNRKFTGKIDDVRVYNYGLSAEEVAYIATGGTGMFTVHSAANLYNLENLGDRAINLRDFAELAKGWLEKKFWPE